MREHADKIIKDADADDGNSIVVVHGRGAATAACAAMCQQADATFRPSAFRSHFPRESRLCCRPFFWLLLALAPSGEDKVKRSVAVLLLPAVPQVPRQAAAVGALAWHIN